MVPVVLLLCYSWHCSGLTRTTTLPEPTHAVTREVLQLSLWRRFSQNDENKEKIHIHTFTTDKTLKSNNL